MNTSARSLLWEKINLHLYEADSARKHDFEAYANYWFTTFSLPNIAQATAASYKRQLDLYWIPGFNGKNVEDITIGDIQSVLNDMPCTAKETKLKAFHVLSMVMQQAVEENIIVRNPAASKNIRISGRTSKETETYTVEQMRYIVSHLSEIKDEREKTYMALQALHPLRLEEVLGLKYEDIDKVNGVIHVRRAVTHPDRNRPEIKDTKTEASKRDIPLVSDAIPYIPDGEPTDFVIGGSAPVSYSVIRRTCEHINRDIGFNEKITPRRFRATVLTDIYDVTKDIKIAQAAAGHTTAEMTLKHYVKNRSNHTESAAVISKLYGES